MRDPQLWRSNTRNSGRSGSIAEMAGLRLRTAILCGAGAWIRMVNSSVVVAASDCGHVFVGRVRAAVWLADLFSYRSRR